MSVYGCVWERLGGCRSWGRCTDATGSGSRGADGIGGGGVDRSRRRRAQGAWHGGPAELASEKGWRPVFKAAPDASGRRSRRHRGARPQSPTLTGDRFLDKTDTTSNSGLGCVAFTWVMVNVGHTEVPRAAVEYSGWSRHALSLARQAPDFPLVCASSFARSCLFRIRPRNEQYI